MTIQIGARAALARMAGSFAALAALSSIASATGSTIAPQTSETAMPMVGMAASAALAPSSAGAEYTSVQPFGEAETGATPHWCNSTGALIANIERLGGESVMRVDLSDGRRLERYWNASEEVTIEHGTDGNSCLVELRERSSR